MPTNTATLKSDGGVPQVEIIVGHAHFAKFEFSLYDATGQNPKTIGQGVNNDTVPDVFDIGSPVSALDKCTVFWQAAIASPTGSPNEQYSVFIRVIQDGNIVGSDSKTGPLTDPPPFGFIRLGVV
jgi:hypothetical protein